MRLLIKNGRVVDPSQDLDKKINIEIEKGIIKNYPKSTEDIEKDKSVVVIDAGGKVVSPGFVDIHVHLREPGFEHKETISTGTRSAAAGGFTSIACMPNTDPVNDNASVTEYILLKARTEGVVNVFPIGAITKGEEGKTLAEIGEMFNAGCVAVSDDGMPVTNSNIMRRAMEYVKPFGIPVITHAEDKYLSDDGVMNEGRVSVMLGLQGIPGSSEEVMIYRDINLAELTDSHLHVAHVSTEGSVRLIRDAKRRGVRVTAEVTPHHFSLTDEVLSDYDTNAKMNPPLRTQNDVKAVIEGLRDGTIDAIATDHAPHSIDEKKVEFALAPFGIVGLETALGLSLKMAEENGMELSTIIEKLTLTPSGILNLGRGTLKIGSPADITVFDPDEQWVVDCDKFFSKAKNSPFSGWKLKGRVKHTIVSGGIVYSDS